MSTVELYFDVVSPYSFLAFAELQRLQEPWRFSLSLHPVFQGAVMASTGNTPPALVPAKRRYMLDMDLPRLARYHRLPLKEPSRFSHLMYHTLPLMRALTAVALQQPTKLSAATRVLFECIWQRDVDVLEAAVLRAALVEAGLTESEADTALAAAATEEVKRQLRRTTDRLLAAGGFGVPTLLVTRREGGSPDGGDGDAAPQLVFGSDRMHVLQLLLAADDDPSGAAALTSHPTSRAKL